MGYLFGDTSLAAQRLQLVSEVYAESTIDFLMRAGLERSTLAMDLGCGPGYSTSLLHDVLPSNCEIVGLDKAESFIAISRSAQKDRMSFHVHDVTAVPFPCGPCDLMYCRLLLCHLTDSQSVINRWTRQLRTGGLLLIEEVESIDTPDPILRQYLTVIEAMLSAQSQTLYMGKEFDSLHLDLLPPRDSRAVSVRVGTTKAAKLFHMNLQQWRHESFIRTKYGNEVIDRLEAGLAQLIEQPGNRKADWTMRQLVLQKTSAPCANTRGFDDLLQMPNS